MAARPTPMRAASGPIAGPLRALVRVTPLVPSSPYALPRGQLHTFIRGLREHLRGKPAAASRRLDIEFRGVRVTGTRSKYEFTYAGMLRVEVTEPWDASVVKYKF